MQQDELTNFEKDSYVIIRGLIDPKWCTILYDYCRYTASRCELKQHNDKEKYREAWDGTFYDKQCPGKYADGTR